MTKQELIGHTKATAINIVNNPLCDKFDRKYIVRKVAALNGFGKKNVTIKQVKQTLEDVLLIAQNIQEGGKRI